ncbi:MAG TPA: hypothetical protein VLJ59_06215 [Mycobacteriales bacterium]|nr:hypothetical protein [Mycobacteriales bacterium]
MLRVDTNGPDNGIVQDFEPASHGYKNVVASAWVYVETGAVQVGTTDGSNGSFVNSTVQRKWELLHVPDSGAQWPVFEIIIFSSHLSGGATFYVDFASVQVSS